MIPEPVRPQEYLWMLIFLVLLLAHLMKEDLRVESEMYAAPQDVKGSRAIRDGSGDHGLTGGGPADAAPHIYNVVARCLTEPSVITVNDKPAADCRPRKEK